MYCCGLLSLPLRYTLCGPRVPKVLRPVFRREGSNWGRGGVSRERFECGGGNSLAERKRDNLAGRPVAM